MATDPVCGMSVEEKSAAATRVHAGATYYLCSTHCDAKFEANPDAYAPGRNSTKVHGRRVASAQPAETYAHGARSAAPLAATYTCPMHPEVRQSGQGTCPKCGMALEPEIAQAPATRTEYVCPMHPQIVHNAPGNCPICGMALEPRVATVEEENVELVDMTRRFWISVALAAPLFVLAMIAEFQPEAVNRFISPQPLQWIEFLLATPVVLWAG